MREPRIFVYSAPINMRSSHGSLATWVSEHGHKLDSGDVFVFFSRKRDQCKIVWHDGEGYCGIDKRLVHGTFTDDISVSNSALQSLLSDGFFGSRELMDVLKRAVKGSKITHISAAKSAQHPRQ